MNILGAFNIIHARNFPATHPSMQLVLRFSASVAERGTSKRVTIKLLNADAVEQASLSADVTVPERPGIAEISIVSIIGLSNMTFVGQGDYAFSILINDDERGRVPFKVLRPEQQ